MEYQRNCRFAPARSMGYSVGMHPSDRSRHLENTEHQRSQSGRSLAMVYSPEQDFIEIYCYEKSLTRGTIFAELDKPLECVR